MKYEWYNSETYSSFMNAALGAISALDLPTVKMEEFSEILASRMKKMYAKGEKNPIPLGINVGSTRKNNPIEYEIIDITHRNVLHEYDKDALLEDVIPCSFFDYAKIIKDNPDISNSHLGYLIRKHAREYITDVATNIEDEKFVWGQNRWNNDLDTMQFGDTERCRAFYLFGVNIATFPLKNSDFSVNILKLSGEDGYAIGYTSHKDRVQTVEFIHNEPAKGISMFDSDQIAQINNMLKFFGISVGEKE